MRTRAKLLIAATLVAGGIVAGLLPAGPASAATSVSGGQGAPAIAVQSQLVGPFATALDCEVARKAWPDRTLACFNLEGEWYFIGF